MDVSVVLWTKGSSVVFVFKLTDFGMASMTQLLQRLGLYMALLLISATAQAQWQQNFLVGASLGYAERKSDLLFSRITPVPQIHVLDTLRPYRDNGYFWGFMGGWQTYCNNWLFGAELNADWHYYEGTRNFAFTQNGTGVALAARFRRNLAIGISGRVGYQVMDYLMPYLRLGVEVSKDKMYTEFMVANSFFTANDQLRTYRFFGGIGLEAPISWVAGLSVRFELNHHKEGKAVRPMGRLADGTLIYTEQAPKMFSGKLSLVYNFI